MRKVLYYLFLLTFVIANAQNPADTDLTIGDGYMAFSYVSKVAVQSDGKILVGGNYYETHGRLARFNSNGTPDTGFQVNEFAQFNSTGLVIIEAIAVQPDGKIVVGGNFNRLNGEGGQSVNGIARLNADGTHDTSFIPPDFTSGNAYIKSICLQPDGKMIIGGLFRVTVNGHHQYDACRLNADGSIDETFYFGPQGGPPAFYGSVASVALQPDGKVLLSGGFSTFNGTPQGTLIRLNPDGTKDTSFDIGTGAGEGVITRKIMVQSDNKILVLGGFYEWNGQSKSYLIRLNENGDIDEGFFNIFSEANGVDNPPYDFTLQPDGKIIAVGGLLSLNDQTNIWRLNSDGTFDSSLVNAGQSDSFRTVAVAQDGKIVIGGYFTSYADKMRCAFTRLNNDGSPDDGFLSPGFNEKVVTIALQENGKVLMGGDFSTFNTLPQRHIIRIDGTDGAKDPSFDIGTGFDGNVSKILVQPDGKILVGGDFTTYDLQSSPGVIRLNPDGSKDTSFNVGSGFNGAVTEIVLQPDGKIILGGKFTSYMDQPQNYLVRLNSNGTKDPVFDVASTLNGRVTAVLLQEDGKIVVGGNFTTVAGTPHRCLARFLANGTKDSTFFPLQDSDFYSIYSPEDCVKDLDLLPDGKMYVTTLISPRRLNPDGSLDDSFTAAIQHVQSVAVQNDGKVIVGGTFYYVANVSAPGIVRLNMDGSVDSGFDTSLDGNANSGSFFLWDVYDRHGCMEVVIQPDKKIWLGGNFFFYRGATSSAAIRLKGDSVLAIDNLDTSADGPVVLYPNPVGNYLSLHPKTGIQIISLSIYDNIGRSILSPTRFDNVNVSGLPQGLYLARIQTNQGITTKKFLRQ